MSSSGSHSHEARPSETDAVSPEESAASPDELAASRRVAQLTAINEGLERRLAQASDRLLEAERDNAELLSLRAAFEQAEREHSQLEERLRTLEARLEASEQARERAEHWVAAMNASVSWRLTAPLRSLKRWARRSVGGPSRPSGGGRA